MNKLWRKSSCMHFFHSVLFELWCANFVLQKFSRKRKFSQNEISWNFAKNYPIFAWFSLFAKMKKTVFVSTLIRSHMRNSFRPWIRAPGWIVWWKKNQKVSWHCPFNPDNLKGQCHEIFDPRFFFIKLYPWVPWFMG